MADVASLGPGRREARERAIGLLYESEARELAVEVLLGEQPLTPANYVVAVLEGVESRRDEIDALVADGSIGDQAPPTS